MESQSQRPSSSPQACPICARQFDRAEHLKRHVATHNKERNLVCGVCGRKFSRKDSLARHDNVHRHHVPLRRFRACTRCAASRVKCSGVSPCVRCRQRSLSCTIPEGSEPRDGPSAGTGANGVNTQYPSPQDPETQTTGMESQHQSATMMNAPQNRTQVPPVVPPHAQPVDLTAHDPNTYMISTLNWVSPSMDFDLAEFDYSTMASGDQYWSSLTDANDLSGQSVSTNHMMRSNGLQSLSTPGTLPDSNDDESPGTSYIDNKGARQPRNGRYANKIFGEGPTREPPRNGTVFPWMAPESEGYSLGLTPFSNLTSRQDPNSSVHPFSLEEFYMMRQAFQDHCLTANGIPDDEPFFSTDFPPLSAFTALLELYRRHFDPGVLPMIHYDIDSGVTSSWVLKLAMSAIGSQYLDTGDIELPIALHEFLRRVLRQPGAIFTTEPLTLTSLGLVQSKLLNYIGMAYCGSQRLDRHKSSTLASLVQECKSLYSRHRAVLLDDLSFRGRREWVLAESTRRLCHAIWLIENMSRYHFDSSSNLLLNLADIALPCKEDLWEADTDGMQSPTKQPTLEEALRVLYVEKRLVKNTGGFARVLLIHGMYCQTWEVGTMFNRPLLRWTPSSRKGDADSLDLIGPTWLPQISLYNQWRNAACDNLDVLHWIANSDIAKAGTESSTVLHLHFARIVLLAPYETIRRVADLLVSEDISGDDAAERLSRETRQVQKWITDDQFKARLALVHCGIFFWHVRRYSLDAFYEPTKVFIVTLVVWAYGSLCPPQQRNTSLRGSSSRNDRSREEDDDWSFDLDDISYIRLDRPCDDELVQLFIKRGRSMKATIMGVGNITANNGSLRMLKEGHKLLSTLEKWPIRHQYLRILTRLIDFCTQNTQWAQTGSGPEQTSRPEPSQ